MHPPKMDNTSSPKQGDYPAVFRLGHKLILRGGHYIGTFHTRDHNAVKGSRNYFGGRLSDGLPFYCAIVHLL